MTCLWRKQKADKGVYKNEREKEGGEEENRYKEKVLVGREIYRQKDIDGDINEGVDTELETNTYRCRKRKRCRYMRGNPPKTELPSRGQALFS